MVFRSSIEVSSYKDFFLAEDPTINILKVSFQDHLHS